MLILLRMSISIDRHSGDCRAFIGQGLFLRLVNLNIFPAENIKDFLQILLCLALCILFGIQNPRILLFHRSLKRRAAGEIVELSPSEETKDEAVRRQKARKYRELVYLE